jgi:hypothetical protein
MVHQCLAVDAIHGKIAILGASDAHSRIRTILTHSRPLIRSMDPEVIYIQDLVHSSTTELLSYASCNSHLAFDTGPILKNHTMGELLPDTTLLFSQQEPTTLDEASSLCSSANEKSLITTLQLDLAQFQEIKTYKESVTCLISVRFELQL